MPAWNALYQIRDFSSHMMQVSARDDAGKPLPIVKLDKQTWQVAGNGTVTVSYPIYWDEPGPLHSQLNPDHAFLNLAMVLLYVPDRRRRTREWCLTTCQRTGAWPWNLIPPALTSASSTGAYVAPSYDALVDAPVEIGQFDEFRIEAGGRPIRIVVHGDAGDRTRLADALKRIVDYQVSLMGGAPFREYMFLFHVGPNFGGGGMEHANCTAISADYSRPIAKLFGARILSRLECKADSSAIPRTGGFHEGDVDTLALVCRGRDEHLRSLYAGADGALVRAAVLWQPGGADQRTGVSSRTPLAKRRAVQSRCVVRKISAL